MNRREFLSSAGATAAAVASYAGHATAAATNSKRNVLLYVADDQGTNDAGCYGNAVVKTPGLDLLASEGVRFTHAFCTTPSCSPSRSVLLTGMHNHANGQYGLAHSYHHFVSLANIKSLPVILGEAGYRTAYAGKYHVLPEDVYAFETQIPGAPSPIEMADRCRDLIASQDDRPFFLYFCTTEPHRPFKRDGAEPVNPDAVTVPPHLPDLPETREELAAYYGSIQRGDSGLLRLIEILKETGRWEDTLVVFVSDNGMPFPGAKTNLYEPGIRLPCVVRNPYSNRRGVCNAMVSWTDITPTLLDFCGLAEKAGHCHGRSFLRAMDDEAPSGWDEIACSHTFHEVTMYYPMRALRTRRYKFIWNIAHGLSFPFASDLWQSKTWQATMKQQLTHYGRRRVDAYHHRAEFELYDLESDPGEVDNLADNPEHAGLLAEMKHRIKAFQTQTSDPWVIKWEHE